MQIISEFKDYYDHVAYIYGGGDPKLRYCRKELDSAPIEVDEGLRKLMRKTYFTLRSSMNLDYLFICGRHYLLIGDKLALMDAAFMSSRNRNIAYTDSLIPCAALAQVPVYRANASKLPILGKTKIPSLFSPEQMYQNIAAYLAAAQPVEQIKLMPDKAKVLSHGFDLKTSFRGK